MNKELPLLDIFNSLRQRHGMLLGVEEYLVVLRSVQAGFGISNRQELEQLCCMLWAKSEEENRLIRQLFKQMWRELPTQQENEGDRLRLGEAHRIPDVGETSTPLSTSFTSSSETVIPKSSSTETSISELFQPDEPLSELETPPSLTPEPVQAVQAVRSSSRDRELKRPRYKLLTEYFPVTKRQMKQCWRYLRRPVCEGVPTEFDVEATVAKIGSEGILLQPVLMPARTNRTDLVLLIDQEGSMVPFHDLSRQLVETAQRGGRLRTTNVFYFHDYPNEYLYRHSAMLDAQPVSQVLEEIEERAVVLIVSDAGAARGNFDSERVESTKAWIEQLQKSVRYYAWLNPMPSQCWEQTTAGEIARFVPMFEMSPQGMNAAINVLRGRYVDRHENLLKTVQVNDNAGDLVGSGSDQALLQESQQSPHQHESSSVKSTSEEIYELLFYKLQQLTKASEQNCRDVATRIAAEVNRICSESKRIQAAGTMEASAITLANHRLQQCLRYYELGSSQGRVELHSTLSAIIYRYINPPQRQLSYQGRLVIIEDFLQSFYLESLNAFRRENQLGATYRPQTLLELSEYMAFTERYAKRRIPLPGRQQQLIILRAQTFSQQQPPETCVDIEQAAEGSGNEADGSWEDPAMQQLRSAMATQPEPEPQEDTLRSVVTAELMNYLEERQQSDCADYFALRLQDLSAQEIESILGLTPRQRDYLQQRFKYHLIRFALLHRWELVHEWLEADLQTNLGLTPQQWQIYTEQLDDKQRSLLKLKQQGVSDERIAKTLGLSMAQLQKQWFKLLEQAWLQRSTDKLTEAAIRASHSHLEG